MKDIVGNAFTKDAQYKDVVVVGNGPSGIALSYMLAGNWPYWNRDQVLSHPDELLRARLNYAGDQKSLVQQDLETLADGLEGRSTNPVSLLLDSLQNPCADIGMTLPSMLSYKFHADKQIDHVVLGKGPPGGSWHRMDPNLRTLSLSTWMSLPGYEFGAWEATHPTPTQNRAKNTAPTITEEQLHCRHCSMDHECASESIKRASATNHDRQKEQKERINSVSDRVASGKLSAVTNDSTTQTPFRLPQRNLAIQRQVSKEVQTRALVSRVAEYYECYVRKMGLEQHFVNDSVVTSVQPLLVSGSSAVGVVVASTRLINRRARWIVRGYQSSTGKPFAYVCRSVVLAVGASDLPNRLGLRGESLGHPWIKHELPQLELALESLTHRERTKLKPVLVIGAGLSAADAVTICRSSQVPVIHVYRNSSVGLDKMLPEAVYPEYHAVHKMMKDSSVPYELYVPLAEHTLVDVATSFTQNDDSATHQVTLLNQRTGTTRVYDVSFCAILIGSRPDLRLLNHVHTIPRTSATVASLPDGRTDVLSRSGGDKLRIPLIDQLTAINLFDASATANDLVNDEHWLLGGKMAWLKNLCLKCRMMNICEWSRRNDYRKLCGHFTGKPCECPKLLIAPPAAANIVDTIEKMCVHPMLVDHHHHHHHDEHDDNVEPATTITSTQHMTDLQLGEDPLKPIDCKSNPIAVNKYTNEVQRTAPGLYAMGPLVGDNFVRFISGGALAITSALHREND